jgi:ATP-dependent helicase HepA
LILEHRTYGYGKVIAVNDRSVTVQFCDSKQRANFGGEALRRGDLTHARLNVDDRVSAPRGEASITSVPKPGRSDEIFDYEIRYDDGLTARVSEVDLRPISLASKESATARLASYKPYAGNKVRAREQFLDALTKLTSQVGGLRALLASRVDLYPHQAYVAGCAIRDWSRRYIFADEVGLGKTIEAGVVIHDLLLQNPEARILILTPGALSRQWLCEMYSGFGGQGFRLLDFYTRAEINLNAFVEVEAKQAARECGAMAERNTRAIWHSIWGK